MLESLVPTLVDDDTFTDRVLALDDGTRVPCSRYGSTSYDCAVVAVTVDAIIDAETGEESTDESRDYVMGLAVNDADDVARTIAQARHDHPRAVYALRPSVFSEALESLEREALDYGETPDALESLESLERSILESLKRAREAREVARSALYAEDCAGALETAHLREAGAVRAMGDYAALALALVGAEDPSLGAQRASLEASRALEDWSLETALVPAEARVAVALERRSTLALEA